jgi:acetyl esterase/lipase
MRLNSKTATMIFAGIILLAAIVLGACSPLTAFNALAPADGGSALAQSGIAYGSLPRQKLDVYTPVGVSGPRPVVVVFYGGSWNSGRRQDYAFLGKALSSRGFVVVIADYRLVPEIRFPAFLEDAALAVTWVHDHARSFGADPARLFLFGHSAGAYIAAMVALDGKYLKAAGASPAIIKGVAALSGPYDFLPLDVDSTRAAFGQAPDLGQTQPINFISSAAPPMFLATGDEDITVRPRNTKVLAEKLSRSGVPVEMHIYPGVGHIGILLALSLPLRKKATVLDDVSAFIAKP